MNLCTEIEANIISIKTEIDREKRRAKDGVTDPSAIESTTQRLRELYVRLTELEHNLREADE